MDNLFSQLEIRIIRSGKNKFKKTIVMIFEKMKIHKEESN